MIENTPMNPGTDVYAQGVESGNEYSANFTESGTESAGFGRRAGLTSRQITRFWSRFQRDSQTGCLLWQGYTHRGYGMVGCGRFPDGTQDVRYTHRVAWQLTRGPIPNGLHVLHHCDTPACAEPSHLFLGTHADNMADSARKGRKGGPRPGRWAFSRELVDLVLSGPKGTAAQLAREHGINYRSLAQAARRARQQVEA